MANVARLHKLLVASAGESERESSLPFLPISGLFASPTNECSLNISARSEKESEAK